MKTIKKTDLKAVPSAQIPQAGQEVMTQNVPISRQLQNENTGKRQPTDFKYGTCILVFSDEPLKMSFPENTMAFGGNIQLDGLGSEMIPLSKKVRVLFDSLINTLTVYWNMV
jgi:hypothetical protein